MVVLIRTALIVTVLSVSLSLETSGWSNPLNGKHFRIGYLENPYAIFTDRNPRGETVVRGYFPDMIKIMSVRANFTYSFVLLNYTRFENLPADFKKHNIDWCATGFGTYYTRNHFTDLLLPLWQSYFGIIIPYPKKQANLWSVVLPYTYTVWLSFFASIAVTGILLTFLARVKRRIHGYAFQDAFLTFEGSILYVVGVATNQGAACFSKARSVRLLAGLWCLAAFVIVNAYSGSLITYMTAPRIMPLVNSIRDLDNKTEPQILMKGNSPLRKAIQEKPQYRFIRDNAMSSPDTFCGTITKLEMETCLNLVKQGTHVIALDVSLAPSIVYADFLKNGACDLTMAEEFFESVFNGWVMPLNSPHWLRNSIDFLGMEVISHGMFIHWDKVYVPRREFCLEYKVIDSSLRKLSLKDFASAFIVLGVGVTLSCIVFAYEIISKKFIRST